MSKNIRVRILRPPLPPARFSHQVILYYLPSWVDIALLQCIIADSWPICLSISRSGWPGTSGTSAPRAVCRGSQSAPHIGFQTQVGHRSERTADSSAAHPIAAPYGRLVSCATVRTLLPLIMWPDLTWLQSRGVSSLCRLVALVILVPRKGGCSLLPCRPRVMDSKCWRLYVHSLYLRPFFLLMRGWVLNLRLW